MSWRQCGYRPVSRLECRQIPQRGLVWFYKCRQCRAEYLARYHNVTGKLGQKIVLVQQVQPRETTGYLLPGRVLMDVRDPILDAVMWGDPIMRA